MIVWVTTGTSMHRRYHAVHTCPRLRAGVARHNTTRAIPVHAKDVLLLPCQHCWPKSVLKYFKPWCGICDTFRACPHNGGILVKTDNGNMWVWPERTGFHQPLRTVS